MQRLKPSKVLEFISTSGPYRDTIPSTPMSFTKALSELVLCAMPLKWEREKANMDNERSASPAVCPSPNEFIFVLPSKQSYVRVSPEMLYCYWPFFARMVDSELAETKSRVCTMPLDFPLNVFADILKCIYRTKNYNFETLGEEEALYALEHGAQYSLLSGLPSQSPAPRFAPLVKHCMEILFPATTAENAEHQLEMVRRIGNLPKKEQQLSNFIESHPRTAGKSVGVIERLMAALKPKRRPNA